MPKITTKTELITPKKAATYVLLNKENRPIRKAWVAELAQMMRDGDFHLTHQGVAFAADGSLKDGQHRLLAIIESGCSVEMNVSRGISDEAMKIIDTGKGRSVADALNLEGHDTDAKDVAIARRMIEGVNMRNSRERPSRMATIRFVVEHAKAIDFARKFPGEGMFYAHASLRAPVARAFYTQDKARLAEFLEVISTGIPKNQDDHAALVLRNHYVRTRPEGKTHRSVQQLYMRTEHAIQDFLNREQDSHIRASKDELFPLPEEKKNGKPK